MGHELFGDHDLLAGAWIASDPWRTTVDREAAEAADLDPMPARERDRHRIDDRLDRELSVAMGQLAESLSQLDHQVGACQWSPSSDAYIGRSPDGTQADFGAARRSARSADDMRAALLASLVVELGAQQRAQARRAGVLAFAGLCQTLHRFLVVGVVLGLDRQLDRTRLAVDVDDQRRDLVAFLQHVAGVLDAVAADFGGTQVA